MSRYTYEPPDPVEEPPLGELFSELTSNLQTLLRKEVELAKIEVQDQMSKATKAGAMFGVGAVAGLLGAILLSFAAAFGLAEGIPTWLAFLAVALLYLAVAGLMFVSGKKRLESFQPVPRQTMETLKEDVDVAKTSLQQGVASSGPSPSSRRY